MSAPAAGSLFSLNPAASVHVETLSSGCPILVIDDCYADVTAVRERALRGRFDASLAFYPGVHSNIDRDEIMPLFRQLSDLLALLGDGLVPPESFISDFSLVTTPARDMLAKQKHPHVDPVSLAGVLYLNPDYEVGTSFFRHRPSGLAFLRSDADREQHGQWLQANGERTQPESYAVADDDTWEHLHSVAGRFNRLVMYPGTAFHSIAMQDVAAQVTLGSARLTQRFFAQHAPTAAR